MVKVKILSARCENFKGFKAFETNFANQTLICEEMESEKAVLPN